ncbi:acyl-CoA dehydrogenase family protein [Actinocrispum wychmicini]|uniref:Alkylation response protein AidB-like acyl-CoA dehydrogenase n=1 Tax=Actinocrispum wychmicini TaxID=1213861 RepID=A0A4V6NNK9_9PSEU|nr:acyl-CoA dehydrogenase family protein [Actinocrispum wychmicini]TCO47420.1 alkylation response protein AidB-like acyl-CoA dehydrogenase [Actinocrispum wychmicini]
MSTAEVPSRAELVQRIAEIAPVIRANAEWSVENRRQHEETVKALTDAGVFRMRVPRRYGGYESDARTMVAVADEIAQLDGATAWVVACSWIATWGLGLFPDAVQDEVFADPDVRVCTTIGPGSATAVPVDGGVVVNGMWPCISGALSGGYQQIVAIVLDPAGEPYPIMSPVALADLEITDDWYTTGFRASESVGTAARDLFIPTGRYLPASMVATSQSVSKLGTGSPMYQPPFISASAASIVGICVGMAKSLRDLFLERLPGRKITYTDYAAMSEAPVTHMRVAEAALKIDEAEFHAQRVAATVDDKAAANEPWEMWERARCRADVGAAMRLSLSAADIFAGASGGSSVYTRVPIQRIVNDLRAHSLHALMTPDVNAEIYGRVLCGLEPNTTFV